MDLTMEVTCIQGLISSLDEESNFSFEYIGAH